jgi:pimeloyl-ACP methyl ester carboxylesterase
VATSSSSPRGRRRSATPCWSHPSPWQPGCSTTTPTATTRSPRAFLDGQPAGHLTCDRIVDNITLYWLTATGASAARSYWENARAQAAGHAPPQVTLPVAFTTFPGEIFQAPRSWVEKTYPTLTYFNKVDKGGHFAAWEEPDLFTTEIRTAFRPLR